MRYILLIFIFGCQILKAQTRLMLNAGNSFEIEHAKYSENYIVQKRVVTMANVKNTTIEELMNSILNETNQDWINYNTLGGAKNAERKTQEDFDLIKKSNLKNTYFKLFSKIDVNFLGENFTLVRFKIFTEQTPNGFTGVYQLQKVNGRWYKTARTDLSNLALMFMMIKPVVFEKTLVNQHDNNNQMKELLGKVYVNNRLDLELLFKEFQKWDKKQTTLEYFLVAPWL